LSTNPATLPVRIVSFIVTIIIFKLNYFFGKSIDLTNL